MNSKSTHPPPRNLPGEFPVIELRGRSFEDREDFVTVLLNTMASCGCWLLGRRDLPPNATELTFELQLRWVFEFYSALLSCGVDLSRDSHTLMKSLCTVRDHNPHRAKSRRILTVRLDLIFMDELDASPDLARTAMGLA